MKKDQPSAKAMRLKINIDKSDGVVYRLIGQLCKETAKQRQLRREYIEFWLGKE